MTVSPDAALLYVALRTVAAALLALRLRRAGEGGRALLGQAAADAAAALFILGVSRVDLRTAVGGWWAVLLLYAAVWEGRRLLLYLDDAMEPPAGEVESGVHGDPVAAWAGTSVAWAWQALAVAPALASGLMLTFDAAFPGVWAFPAA